MQIEILSASSDWLTFSASSLLAGIKYHHGLAPASNKELERQGAESEEKGKTLGLR